MWNSSTNPDEDIETIIRDSGDMLFRICFLLLGNTYDTEYVIQYKPFLANDTKELFEEIYNEIVARGNGTRTTKMTIVLKTTGCLVNTEIQYVAAHDDYLELTGMENHTDKRAYIPYENISHIVWKSE